MDGTGKRAATTRTKKTAICPSTDPRCFDAVIKVKLTAFSMSSIHINIINAFFLTIIPKKPIEKRIAESVRYQSDVTSIIVTTLFKFVG